MYGVESEDSSLPWCLTSSVASSKYLACIGMHPEEIPCIPKQRGKLCCKRGKTSNKNKPHSIYEIIMHFKRRPIEQMDVSELSNINVQIEKITQLLIKSKAYEMGGISFLMKRDRGKGR